MRNKFAYYEVFHRSNKIRRLAGMLVFSLLISLFGGVMSETMVAQAADSDMPSCGTISVTYTSTSNNKSTFTISRTGGSDGEQVVYYRTVNGSAIGGTNFTHVSGSVTFAHGDTASKTVTVTEQGANIQYGSYVATKYTNADRTYSFQIYDIKGGATIGTASASRTLTKNSSYTIAQNVYTKEAKYEGYGTDPTLLSHDNKYAADRSGGEKGDAYFINDRGNNVSQDYRNFNTYARIDGFGYYGKQENKERDFYDANVAEYLKNTSDSYLWRCYYAGDRNDDGYCHTWVGDNNAGILSLVRADTGTNRVKDGGINYNGSGQGFCSYTTDDSTFGDSIPGSDYGTNGTSNNKRYTRYLNGWNRRMYYGGTDSNSCYFKMGIHETVWFLTSASGSGEDKWHVYCFCHYIRPYDKKAPSLIGIAPMADGTYEIGKPMTIALVFDEIVDSSKSSLSASSYITTSQGQFKYSGGANTNVLYFTGTPTTAANTITVSNINCASSIKDMMGLVSATSSQASASVTIGNIAPTYTVKLVPGNGGAYQYITATNAAAMPDVTVPTRQAYSFDGYYDAASGGTQYIKADGKSARAFDKNANVVLYAHWKADPPTITYEPEPCQNLVYRAVSYGLVTTGTVSNGTMYYKLDDGEWSTHIPTRSGAGTYTVSYQARGEGGNSDVKSVTVTIKKADISPSVSINSWTYSETVGSPTVSGNTDGGAVSFSYKKKGESDSSYTKVKPSDVGEYTVRATIAATANYNGGTATKDFTITKKTVTVSSGIEAGDKVYDGTVAAELDTSRAVLDGKKEGDDLTVTATGTFDSKDAGTEKTVTISGLTLGGEDAGNYQLATTGNQETTTAAINKRSITLTSGSAEKIYDGSPVTNSDVAVAGDGFVEGEGAAYTVTGSQTLAGSSDNTFTYTFNTNTSADNYGIECDYGTLTVTRVGNAWTTNPSIEGWTYGDAPNEPNKGTAKFGDAGDAVVKYKGRNSTAYAESTAAPTAAGDYTAVFILAGTDNYATLTDTVDFTIKQREVTVSAGIEAGDKTYDGTVAAEFDTSGAVLDGKKEGDDLTITATGTFDSKDAGTEKTVTISGLTLGGEDAGNYQLATTGNQETTTAAINKRSITLTSGSAEKIYDGSPVTNSDVAVAGDRFAAGEGAAYTVTGSQTLAGRSDNTFTYTFDSDTDEANYAIETVYGSLTVSSMSITAAVIDFSDFVYGTIPPASPVLKAGDMVLDGAVSVRYYIKQTAFLKSETASPYAVAAAGKLIDTLDFQALSVGSYYICAVVEETANHSEYITQKVFRVMPSNAVRSAPERPAVDVSDMTVTVAEADRKKSLEYSLDKGNTWNSVPAMSESGSFMLPGLAEGDYTIILREKADNNNSSPSGICAPVSFTLTGFSVSYDANGGTGAPQSQRTISSDTIEIADGSGMSRTGYTFLCWSTQSQISSDGTDGTTYHPGDTVSTGLILYAVWQPNSYTVNFEANGGTGSMEPQGFEYGKPLKLSKNEFTHEDSDNWTFLGWAKSPRGDAVYSDEQIVENLTAEDGGTITLYAIWYKSAYNIVVEVISDKSDPITVQIKRGNAVLRTKTTDELTSSGGNDGAPIYSASFIFSGMPQGTYNAVATQTTAGTERIMTKLAELSDDDQSLDIEMPKGDTNSILKIDGSDTPPVMVGGLDNEATDMEVAGRQITVTMTVEAVNDDAIVSQPPSVSSICSVAEKETVADIVTDAIQFLDITIVKEVSEPAIASGGGVSFGDRESVETITETKNVMEIVVPYDFTKKSKVMVYRAHMDADGELEVKAFEESGRRLSREASDVKEGFFYTDRNNGYIFIYAKKFSTYAIAYEAEKEPSASGDSSDSDNGAETGSGSSGGDNGVETGSGSSGGDTGVETRSGSSGGDTGVETRSGLSGGDNGVETGNGASGSGNGVETGDGASDGAGASSGNGAEFTDYTISFNANGGEGTMAGQSTNGTVALSANAFTRSGYRFIGWNTEADGTGTAYADQASVTPDVNMTLYAQWEKISDKVTKKEKTKAKIDLNAGFILQTKGKKVTVRWGKVEKADRYVVYAAYCGKDYKKIAMLDEKRTIYTFTKLNNKVLNTKKNVKCYVVAYRKVNGKYVRLSRSITGHAAGSASEKYTNVRRIRLRSKSIKLAVNNSYKVKAKLVAKEQNKKLFTHTAACRYASSDTSVATVNEKGKITAKKKGTCYVYVYAQNGCAAKLKVSIK